jgi:tetratricopeptide (TPR) repeat protein
VVPGRAGRRPGNPATLVSLGNALLDQGNPGGAIAEYREAIRLAPEHALAHCNLGMALWRKGDRDGALDEYRQAIRLKPDLADAHFNLATALWMHKRDLDGAIVEYRVVIRLNPNEAIAHINIGAILCDRKQDYDGAIACFEAAIRLNPNEAIAHGNLGFALRQKGDLDRAADEYREAIRLNPKYAKVHYCLAWLLAAGPDRLRDGKQAVEHAARACELTDWKDPAFIEVLAAAHAEAGDFDRAVEFQKKALAFPDHEKPVGKAGQERLQHYARKKPYRDPDLAPRPAPGRREGG